MARVIAISLNPALDLSIQLDAVRPGEVNRSESSRMDAAGKGNNVARVLRALGHDVLVTGFLGEDNQGAFERAFAAWGVEDAFVRVPGETRVNVKLSEADGRVTDINGPGAQVGETYLAALEAVLADHAGRASAVVMAGSLPPGVSPERFEQLVRFIGTLEVPVWLDTSGAALKAGFAAVPFAVKPNDVELGEWLGAPVNGREAVVEAARRLNETGIHNVFVSLGGDGMVLSTPAGVWSARPPAVEVVSTVCAGDTLVAAALHGELMQWPVEETLRFATALSADAVRHVGVGDIHATDLETLKTQCVLQQLTDGRPAGEWRV
ncbi:1-phosphofructokinase [Larsenimonas rhizosphaerae]|uniref:Phosphofructokinase n=1 Tax=Larsenimonas rhizosphaerae TaxID=2944682 RepID=A0AA42CWI2_9GAMM|nr:1-phosphofructokinase [Larsenimonas rhizosphaerae]MCX2522668.1 1-phosphofructokinase [Larsenimonas rhizosphaerae]